MLIHLNLFLFFFNVLVHCLPQNGLSELISSNPDCDPHFNSRSKRTLTADFPDNSNDEDISLGSRINPFFVHANDFNHFTFRTASKDDFPTISIPKNAISDTNGVFFLTDDRQPEDIPPREFGRCPSGKFHACCRVLFDRKTKICDFYSDSVVFDRCEEEWQCCAVAPSDEHDIPKGDPDTCEPIRAYEPIPHNIPDPAPTDIPQSPPPRPAPEFFCPSSRMPPSI